MAHPADCSALSLGFRRWPVLPLLAALSGCGNLGICSNKCSPPLVHDSFCGCVDWSDKPSAPGNATPTAACICSYSSGVVGAWFPYQPSIYPDTSKKLTVFASGCSDLTVCELIKDGNSEHYSYLTGRVTIDPLSWQKKTDLWGGGSVWTLFGKVTNNKADAGGLEYTPINWARTAVLINRELRAAEPAAFTNSGGACRNACKAGSPYCYELSLDKDQTAGLIELRSILSSGDASIPPSKLLSMFGQTADPCLRGGTQISAGEISNEGGACDLQSSGTISGISAVVRVPGILAGQITAADKLISVDFPHSETRAQLNFSDADIQSEWGGEIKSAFADAERAGFAVGDKSCISVLLK